MLSYRVSGVKRQASEVSVNMLISVAFGLVLAAGLWHAYTIRYSFRKSPAVDKDKMYSCAVVHFVSVAVVFM